MFVEVDMSKQQVIVNIAEILTEFTIIEDGMFLVLDKESAEGLIDMIREQLAEME